MAVSFQLFYDFGCLLDDNEGKRLGGELPADEGAHPAETADNVVIPESLDLFLHLFPPHNALELPFEHYLGQASNDIAEHADTENDEHHSKDLARLTQGVDFLEADSGKGDYRHVECVEEPPSLDTHVTKATEGDEQGQNDNGNFEMPYRVHRIRLRQED